MPDNKGNNNGGKNDGKGGKNDGKGGGNKDPKTTMSEYGFNRRFLQDHPEVERLVKQAFNQQWTVERFQAEVKDTKWWQRTAAPQRQWDMLEAESPQEAQRQVTDKTKDLRTQAAQMGVPLGDNRAEQLARSALRNGMTETEILSFMAGQFDITPDLSNKQEKRMTKREEEAWFKKHKNDDPGLITGVAGETVTQLEEMSRAYGITVSNKTLQNQVQKVIRGEENANSLQDFYIEQAKALYPTLEAQLNGGRTVQDMLTPYQEIAAKELGMVPDAMDPTDKKWTAALTGGKDGLMSADEWQQTVRNDARYGWDKGAVAKQMAAQLTNDLAKMFGAA